VPLLARPWWHACCWRNTPVLRVMDRTLTPSEQEKQRMNRLDGKVAVVTGGSSGIGLATANLFADEGAYVYITGRHQNELDKAVQQIGKNVTAVQGDVSNLADLDRLYDLVKRQHGRVDVLFANAGGGGAAPLGAISEDQFTDTFNSDVKGVLFTVQKALPLLHQGSSVILNASVAASTAMEEGFSIYSAAKAAVRSFARTWTIDLKDRQIRVNAISPGIIDTPLVNNVGLNKEKAERFKTHLVEETPMGRMGAPDEVAKAVLFLASDDSSFVTGTELFADGGMAQV
jgi:NAD(P)-dependent dehydrogenase (short-subunit alcohol dehydrogenase family)